LRSTLSVSHSLASSPKGGASCESDRKPNVERPRKRVRGQPPALGEVARRRGSPKRACELWGFAATGFPEASLRALGVRGEAVTERGASLLEGGGFLRSKKSEGVIASLLEGGDFLRSKKSEGVVLLEIPPSFRHGTLSGGSAKNGGYAALLSVFVLHSIFSLTKPKYYGILTFARLTTCKCTVAESAEGTKWITNFSYMP